MTACIGAMLALVVVVQTVRVEHYREQLRKRGESSACAMVLGIIETAREVRHG